MPKSRRISVTIDELYSHTERTNGGCLIWLMHKDAYGYGKFRINGEKQRVNRLVCQLVYGKPFANAMALHSCDNPSCINADHLRWGTAKDNVADMHLRNRQPRRSGTATGRAKLSDEIVMEILNRNLKVAQYRHVAKEFGVTPKTISHIVNGLSWKHLHNVAHLT